MKLAEAGPKMTAKIGRATAEDLPGATDVSGAVAPKEALQLSMATPVSQGAEGIPLGSEAMVDYANMGKGAAPEESAKTPGHKVFPKQGEHLAQDGEHYIYRGFGGIPFRSTSKTPPDIKARDPKQPMITADAKVEIFDFSNPDDVKRYTMIWDRATKGLYVAPIEERQWVPELKTWKVFVRYGIKYWELPND